jgi:hypothetical protein
VVVDMPRDSFYPIIFGRAFLNIAGATIDCKQETISLKFGAEEVTFDSSKFKTRPYYKEFEEKEGKTIAELAAIFYGTRKDELERSLIDNDCNTLEFRTK